MSIKIHTADESKVAELPSGNYEMVSPKKYRVVIVETQESFMVRKDADGSLNMDAWRKELPARERVILELPIRKHLARKVAKLIANAVGIE